MFTVQSVFSLEGMFTVLETRGQVVWFKCPQTALMRNNKIATIILLTGENRKYIVVSADNSEQMMVGRIPRPYRLARGYSQFIILPSIDCNHFLEL